MSNVLKFKKLCVDAITPKYETSGAACFDIASIDNYYLHVSDSILAKTGLAFEVPEDHVMLVFSRSGHGAKRGVRLSNCVGVIDSDYRGELMVSLHSDRQPLRIEHGDRIAQAMVIKCEQFELMQVEELSETDRGSGGFGSTGK